MDQQEKLNVDAVGHGVEHQLLIMSCKVDVYWLTYPQMSCKVMNSGRLLKILEGSLWRNGNKNIYFNATYFVRDVICELVYIVSQCQKIMLNDMHFQKKFLLFCFQLVGLNCFALNSCIW
jgi:hypothetical protein